MPLLDVSELLVDPDLAEPLVIWRRAVIVGNNGRNRSQITLITPAPWGVVTSQSDQPIQRGPDQQNLPRLIRVTTQFHLQGPSPNFLGDIVIWKGDQYAVNKADGFTNFGGGFVGVDCSSIDPIDLPF